MVWHERRSSDRHLIELPIKFRVLEESKSKKRSLDRLTISKSKNISDSGILFLSSEAFELGVFLEITFPVKDKVFVMEGKVVHVDPDTQPGFYQIGIYFHSANHVFKVKMAEQLRQIHQYQQSLSKEEGRIVSEEEAAEKWIEKNSDHFADFFKTGS